MTTNRYASLNVDGILNNECILKHIKHVNNKQIHNPREIAYMLLSNKTKLRYELVKTKMCRNIDCKKVGCTYAHSETELQIRKCLFGNECIYKDSKNNTCKYIHPNESVNEYNNRVLSVNSIKKIIL
jgi:hypothetical protein